MIGIATKGRALAFLKKGSIKKIKRKPPMKFTLDLGKFEVNYGQKSIPKKELKIIPEMVQRKNLKDQTAKEINTPTTKSKTEDAKMEF